MGFNDILKSLFGNKSDRDMKELMPIVAKVNAEWEKLKSISADELRAVAEDMKKRDGSKEEILINKKESNKY